MIEQKFNVFSQNNGKFSRKMYEPQFIITSDTDSVYINLTTIFDQNTDKDVVIDYSDKLGIDVNQSFPLFLRHVFNIPDNRTKIIKTDREVVSDKSFFCAKKKYVMHVINEEGIDKDKTKVVGMEIKKSDTPVVIQDFLRDLVNMLMDDATYENVETYVKAFKCKFITLGMNDIGWPTTIKNLSKYLSIYQDTNDMKGFPYHVKASMFYNDNSALSDIMIRNGSKIKVVYIKHRDSESVAIPTDSDILSNFVNGLEIDWDIMWSKVQKKINIYLKPVGYDRDSRQQILTNKFVEF
jgi:DNA polymerase elongation subunit (family B)